MQVKNIWFGNKRCKGKQERERDSKHAWKTLKTTEMYAEYPWRLIYICVHSTVSAFISIYRNSTFGDLLRTQKMNSLSLYCMFCMYKWTDRNGCTYKHTRTCVPYTCHMQAIAWTSAREESNNNIQPEPASGAICITNWQPFHVVCAFECQINSFVVASGHVSKIQIELFFFSLVQRNDGHDATTRFICLGNWFEISKMF